MSAIVPHVTGGSVSIAAGATRYVPLGVGAGCIGYVTEAHCQVTYRFAGVIRNLYTNVTVNSTGGTNILIKTRINGANGNLSISVPAGTTGDFEDVTNSDSFVAGDEINYIVDASGATGVTIMALAISSGSVHASQASTQFRLINNDQKVFSTNSTSRVEPITGNGIGRTLANEVRGEMNVNAAGTLKNLFVYVSANARTTNTTFKSRKNRVDGAMSVAVGSGGTGVFEDTTNSDTVALNDEICFGYNTGSGGGNITFEIMSAEYVTTDNKFFMMAAVPANTSVLIGTFYRVIAGDLSIDTATEANVQTKVYQNMVLSNLWVEVGANITANTVTVRLRVDGANGNMSVAYTGTGVFEDTTNTDAVKAGQKINYSTDQSGSGSQNEMDLVAVTGLFKGGVLPPPKQRSNMLLRR